MENNKNVYILYKLMKYIVFINFCNDCLIVDIVMLVWYFFKEIILWYIVYNMVFIKKLCFVLWNYVFYFKFLVDC